MIEQGQEEKFVNDVSELLEYLLQESVRLIGKAPDDMSKEDKMRALRFWMKGALLITKSGTRICKFWGFQSLLFIIIWMSCAAWVMGTDRRRKCQN